MQRMTRVDGRQDIEARIKDMATTRLPAAFAELVRSTPHIFAQAVQDLQAPRVAARVPVADGSVPSDHAPLNCCLLGGTRQLLSRRHGCPSCCV